MATIYKLTADDEQIGDIYYNENDAVDNAIQIVIDPKNPIRRSVGVWVAEEIEDVPLDALDWVISRVVWA